MLPFLKNRQEASASSDDDPVERKPDEVGLLDAVASDLLRAFEKKDKKLLKEALEALCEHIQSLDEAEDQLSMGEMT
jgi:hypothetical protein